MDRVICKVCQEEFEPIITHDGDIVKLFVPKHYKKSLVGGLRECQGSYERVDNENIY